MLPEAFTRYIEQSPVCVMSHAVLERLFEPGYLDELFRTTAEVQYERQLLFSSVVELMVAVVLGAEPSVYAAWRKRRKVLPVTDDALYSKLQNMELGISAALVGASAAQAKPLIEQLQATQAPWLLGYNIKILDGNHLAATEHRLKVLWDTWAAPLPGTVLVVLDPQLGLATDAFLTPDGHASERSLLDDVLACVKERDLWMADRNFCTLKFLFEIAKKLGFFLIRQHGTIQGTLKGPRRFIGECSTGRVFEQQIELTYQKETRTWRRISIELDKPTRDGDWVIHLLTNLPEEVSALECAELYRKRWSIETLFYEVTQTLQCEIQALCYPKAALFVFCLALLAANACAVLKAAVRATHGEEIAQQTSGYYMALEVKQVHAGMMIALPPEQWVVFTTMTNAQFAAQLQEIARHMDLGYYRKSTRGPKKPPTEKDKYRNGGHVATHKLLTDKKH
jgi:hypothetical protein